LKATGSELTASNAVNARAGCSGTTFKSQAGALGFRDFPGSLVMKENRTGNHRTLPAYRALISTRIMEEYRD